jgi:transposase
VFWDPSGEVRQEFRLRMKEEDFQTYFASIPHSRAAVEAGGQSRWVAEVIEKCGHEVYVSNTRKVPYIHQSDDKDDPRDAYKLAERGATTIRAAITSAPDNLFVQALQAPTAPVQPVRK